MVARTVTNDGSYLVNHGFGLSQEGLKRVKVQNGGDSIPTNLKKRILAMPERTYGRPKPIPYVDKRGHTRFRKEARVPFSRPRKPLPKKKVRLKRTLPPNAYRMDLSIDNFAVWRYTDKSNVVRDTTLAAMQFGHISLDPKDYYNLIERLRRKVYGSGFNPGIFAAEFPKAITMIFDAATKIRRGLLFAAIGDWRGIVRNLGAPNGAQGMRKLKEKSLSYREGRMNLSQLWLELQYGWRPLVGDLEDAGKYIAYVLNDPGYATSKRVKTTKSFEKSSVYTMGLSELGFSYRKTVHDVSITITNLRVSPSYVPSLQSAATVAWEVLPYSFVCDWVAPIGSYLGSLRTQKDITGTVVTSVKSTTTWSLPRYGGWIKSASQLSVVPAKKQLITLVRTVSDELYVPAPLGDLSPSSVFSSATRAWNAVALLQNLKFTPGDVTGIRKLLGRS